MCLTQGKADQYQRIQAGIAALAADAVRVLGEVMNNPGAPDADRRAAAVAILDRLAPMSEEVTDERLARLAAATMEAERLTKMAAAENDACMARILSP